MKVVVVGGAGLAEQVAEEMADEGHEVTLVEPAGEQSTLRAAPAVRYLPGDGVSPAVLEAAGARCCDVLVACTRADEDNLVISLLAKRRFAVGRIVARVNEPDNAWLFDESWGVDEAVSPSSAFAAVVRRGAGATPDVVEPGQRVEPEGVTPS